MNTAFTVCYSYVYLTPPPLTTFTIILSFSFFLMFYSWFPLLCFPRNFVHVPAFIWKWASNKYASHVPCSMNYLFFLVISWLFYNIIIDLLEDECIKTITFLIKEWSNILCPVNHSFRYTNVFPGLVTIHLVGDLKSLRSRLSMNIIS